MRAKVDKDRWPAGTIISSEKGWRGSGNFSHARPMRRASSAESMRSETPVTTREAFNFCAVCTMASKGSTPGTTSNSTVLPSFSAISQLR